MLSLTTLPHRATAEDVLADLSHVGLTLVDVEPSPGRLIELVHALVARVVPHPDSGPDGVTVIEDRGHQAAALAGFTLAALRCTPTGPASRIRRTCS